MDEDKIPEEEDFGPEEEVQEDVQPQAEQTGADAKNPAKEAKQSSAGKKQASPSDPAPVSKTKEEKKLIEAALFISSRAMSLSEFRALTGIGALGYLQTVVETLRKEYDRRDSAIQILDIDGKYEMRIRNDVLERVKQFAQDIEISKSALRTLAFISKHDGILKSQLVKKIGTKVYDDVRELVEEEFVKSVKAGRTSKLTLTEKFRKYFVQAPKVESVEAPIEQTKL
jgi:segregation and condensation protein B